MRHLRLAVSLLAAGGAAGCGSVGLDPFGDSGGGGDLSDALDVAPTGPVSFENVSPYVEPVPTETLTLTNVGDDTLAITDIGLSEASSRAFGVDAPDSLYPLRLKVGDVFDFDVYFPSENYQDRDQTGNFNGQVVITFEVGQDSEAVEVSKTVTGVLCLDYEDDGICG